MIVSGTRSILAGATCTVLPLVPGDSGAQPLTRSSYTIGSNPTRRTQNEINIALPSIAPLVDRVTPVQSRLDLASLQLHGTDDRGDHRRDA